MALNSGLKRRIIEISHKHKLSHLGSCLTTVDILNDIYRRKKADDKVILSSGHAGLALYVVLEKYDKLNAEDLFNHHGVHPDRCSQCHIDVSTGSLGHGLGIAVGMAMANRKRRVFVVCSDGEMAEGSMYEALNIAKQNDLNNLEIHINCNGYSAYRNVYPYQITNLTATYQQLDISIHATHNELPFLQALDAHYYTMTDKDYELAKQIYD